MINKSIKKSDPLSVLAEISRSLSKPHGPMEMLNNIVNIIKERFQTDVCSLYLEEDGELVLSATNGLNPDAIGKVKMNQNEGLTGLAYQTLRPVAEEYASRHPRFKFFPDLGEEVYESYLGVPLISRKGALGVLVVQTIQPRKYSKNKIKTLITISSQLSGVIINARLMHSVEQNNRENEQLRKELEKVQSKLDQLSNPKAVAQKTDNNLHGIIGSNGIGIGKAVLLEEDISFSHIEEEQCLDIEKEVRSFQAALELSTQQIIGIKESVNDTLTEQDSAIFHSHLMILEDRSLTGKVIKEIQKGFSAPWAIKVIVSWYVEAFSKIEDPYLRERAGDVKDVGQRLLRNIFGVHGITENLNLRENSIIIADDLTPSQLVSLDLDKVKGFILGEGGAASHFSLLCKAYEIPALVGLGKCIHRIKEDDQVIIDCENGVAIIKPEATVEKEYQQLNLETEKHLAQLNLIKDDPCTTNDGVQVELNSNIGFTSELPLLEKYGATGIGLFRTEITFLSRETIPTEEEQFEIYSNVLKTMGSSKPTMIRTMDIGGDKMLPYLKFPEEQNPFLGWRSIRVSLEMRDMFKTQLRALIRASQFGNLHIMFPMISGLGEFREAKNLFVEIKNQLIEEGYSLDYKIPVGIMIEVPSAVSIADKLAREADFFSIGTNDLVQYTLAVDRNNQKVANLYDPLHPAVLSQIRRVVQAANEANIKISICGEMAGVPECFLPLLGLGIRSFSMTSSRIPIIKDVLRKIDLLTAEELGRSAIEMDTPEEIRRYLKESLKYLDIELEE